MSVRNGCPAAVVHWALTVDGTTLAVEVSRSGGAGSGWLDDVVLPSRATTLTLLARRTDREACRAELEWGYAGTDGHRWWPLGPPMPDWLF